MDLIFEDASIPTSELIKNSSISSNFLSLISFFITISLKPSEILFALFLKPNLNFSKILIIILLLFFQFPRLNLSF